MDRFLRRAKRQRSPTADEPAKDASGNEAAIQRRRTVQDEEEGEEEEQAFVLRSGLVATPDEGAAGGGEEEALEDGQQTPPRLQWGSFLGAAVEQSPGEFGGSQYIQSPPQPRRRSSLGPRELGPVAAISDEDAERAFAAIDSGIGTGRGARAGDAADGEEAPASAAPPPVFPVFHPIRRRKSGRKVLHLVRHGESEFNYVTRYGKSFEDPTDMFDTRLTVNGRQQARQMAEELRAAKIPDDALWICSALTRAIQTCMIARRGVGAPPERDGDIIVRPDLAEQLCTCGDVGRPRSELLTEFPNLTPSLSELAEEWWFSDPNKPNEPVPGGFRRSEPKDEFKRRVGRFRRWAEDRPEKHIVVFAHHNSLRELSAQAGEPKSLRNCEYVRLEL
mmetsp:Transcript_8753/g.28788  ORF Transcript_8753/g.28788 Transcript_8753/m.28788 type:complete len:391 (+) Transcript_8753:3-1175(+)